MLRLTPAANVYLKAGATDMRKSIDGLALIVRLEFNLDPFSQSMFVFCNRARDKIKILFWDHNGFWLYYRRLERGRFKWPSKSGDGKPVAVTERELSWLLDGLTLEEKGAHRAVKQRRII